jgi:hypothetical protein
MFSKRKQMKLHRSKTTGQGGQSLTEFAFTMPLLVALLAGIMGLAWIGYSYVSITSAARMGARHLLTYPQDPEDPIRFSDIDAEVTYIVTTSMPFVDWRQATIVITPPIAERVVDPSDPVYVQIQITYQVNLPTIEIPYIVTDGSITVMQPLNLRAKSRMRLD